MVWCGGGIEQGGVCAHSICSGQGVNCRIYLAVWLLQLLLGFARLLSVSIICIICLALIVPLFQSLAATSLGISMELTPQVHLMLPMLQHRVGTSSESKESKINEHDENISTCQYHHQLAFNILVVFIQTDFTCSIPALFLSVQVSYFCMRHFHIKLSAS